MMNGAQALIKTAVAGGVDICFANPGTTEMPLVQALDDVKGIRTVLGLFEGVCTGAADGYGRMLQKPAMTLLHLGPGFANGIANLHNARRAHTPIFNVIGEHCSWHQGADAPLTMNIKGLCDTVCHYHFTTQASEQLSLDTYQTLNQAYLGKVTGLVVAHDHQWGESPEMTPLIAKPHFSKLDSVWVENAAKAIKQHGDQALLVLGGQALSQKGVQQAVRLQKATKCRLITETFPAKMDRGPSLPHLARIPYFPEEAMKHFKGYSHIYLLGASEPVAFFGYENGISRYRQEGQTWLNLCHDQQSVVELLCALSDSLDAPDFSPALLPEDRHRCILEKPLEGRLTGELLSAWLAYLQPENAIIVDEAITSGLSYYHTSAHALPHSLLCLTGGAIGQGIPLATGAALACPDRPVIDFQADGSALYTLQGLWTQARENLNVTTIICANRGYDILKFELLRAGVTEFGTNAVKLTHFNEPANNFVQLANGFGVPATAVTDTQQFTQAFHTAMAQPGPYVIEVIL